MKSLKNTTLALLFVAGTCLATLSASYAPDQYNTNGSVTQFSASWGFFSKTDLIVTYTDSAGVDLVLVEGAGAGKFTVYAANSDYSSGATITTGTTYPSSGRITIERSVPYGQALSINGDFIPAKPLETQLDKLAAQTQQTEDSIGRTLTIPATDVAGLTTEFPNVATRASKVMAFDASGNVTVHTAVTSGTVYVDEVSLTSTTNLLSIKALGVDTAEIAAFAVDYSKMATNSVQTYAITNEAVTLAKLADLTSRSLIGNVTGASATPTAVAIIDDDTLATATTNNLPTSESVKAYVDASDTDSYSPTAYAGGESVTFPNGLIMKMGLTAGPNGDLSGVGTTNVIFGTAFPTGLVSVSVVGKDDLNAGNIRTDVSSTATTGFTIGYDTDGGTEDADGFYWQAIGY